VGGPSLVSMDALLAAALFARITVITPRDTMSGSFEAGYRRHLQWHRAHGDPWTWHGWTVVSGERLGAFVDGTFGHPGEDFDHAVASAEDASDNQGNVAPFATFAGSAFYRMRPDLGAAAPEDLAAPFATLVTVRARPGQRQAAEAALSASRGGAIAFELVRGGRASTYLLVLPAKTLGATLDAAVPDSAAFESVTVETLRYRTDLTYVPEAGAEARPRNPGAFRNPS
jgi:hypothetical protein